MKIEHEYEVKRGGEVLATASTTLACLDRDGRPREIPEEIHHGEHGGTRREAKGERGTQERV